MSAVMAGQAGPHPRKPKRWTPCLFQPWGSLQAPRITGAWLSSLPRAAHLSSSCLCVHISLLFQGRQPLD